MSVPATGTAATALGASTTPGASPATSDTTTQPIASPATQGAVADASDATTNTSLSQADTRTETEDDDDSDEDEVEENASVPYDRFKKVIESKNKQKERAKAATAAATEAQRKADEAETRAKDREDELAGYNPILEQVRQAPEVQAYLKAGVPLSQAVVLAQADADRAKNVLRQDQDFEQNLQAWQAHLVDHPEDLSAFIAEFAPVAKEVTRLRPLAQDVQWDARRYQVESAIEGLITLFPHADKDTVTRLARTGDLEGAKAIAERTHTSEVKVQGTIAAERAQIERDAIARYQKAEKERASTPTPAGAGPDGGEPVTGAKPLLPGRPDPKKDPKGYVKWFDDLAAANGRARARG